MKKKKLKKIIKRCRKIEAAELHTCVGDRVLATIKRMRAELKLSALKLKEYEKSNN